MKMILIFGGVVVLGVAIFFVAQREEPTSTEAFATDAVVTESTDETSEVSEESQEAKAWRLIIDGALLIDVRTEEEFSGGHLSGATLIPHDQVPARLAEFGDDKQAQIVLYCRSGNRAGKAETALRAAGYENVFNGGGYEPLMQSKPAE